MTIQVARWGNSLAVRIPAPLAKRAGWKAGDEINVKLTESGELVFAPVPASAQASVRGGLGLLSGRKREALADDDTDAKLLHAVREDDQASHT